MNDIEKRLGLCFSNVFPMLTAGEIKTASTASLPEWDSMAHVALLSSVGEEFAIEFELEDFEDLVSYGLILDRLENPGPQ